MKKIKPFGHSKAPKKKKIGQILLIFPVLGKTTHICNFWGHQDIERRKCVRLGSVGATEERRWEVGGGLSRQGGGREGRKEASTDTSFPHFSIHLTPKLQLFFNLFSSEGFLALPEQQQIFYLNKISIYCRFLVLRKGTIKVFKRKMST